MNAGVERAGRSKMEHDHANEIAAKGARTRTEVE